MTTADKLADLRARLDKAQDPGSERSRARRDEAGRTTPRQRIDALLDEGSFVEIGALARTPGDPDAVYSDGVVTGYGRIDGRPVAVYAHDKTVYGGSVGVTFGRKVTEVMEFAIKISCPVIGIQDSGGARIQDAVTSLAMYSEIAKRQLPLSGRVPQISIMLGKSAGGAVYAPVTTDFVVAVDGESEMYVTGPNVIREVTGEDITSAELGGGDVLARDLADHVRAGDVHLALTVDGDNKVRGHRRVHGAAGGLAQHDGNLRHAPGKRQLALGNLGIHGQRRHRVLDARAAGVLDANHRAGDLDGELHHLRDLAAERHADGPAVDGLVVCVDGHGASVDAPVAGDHAVRVNRVRVAGGAGEGADFHEGALVQQGVDALAWGGAPGLVAAGPRALGPGVLRLVQARAQVRELVSCGHRFPSIHAFMCLPTIPTAGSSTTARWSPGRWTMVRSSTIAPQPPSSSMCA